MKLKDLFGGIKIPCPKCDTSMRWLTNDYAREWKFGCAQHTGDGYNIEFVKLLESPKETLDWVAQLGEKGWFKPHVFAKVVRESYKCVNGALKGYPEHYEVTDEDIAKCKENLGEDLLNALKRSSHFDTIVTALAKPLGRLYWLSQLTQPEVMHIVAIRQNGWK